MSQITASSSVRIPGHGLLAVGLSALAVACGGSPTTPTPPPIAPPVISCPASQSVQSPNGDPVSVNFPQPTVTGGQAPLSQRTCTAQSGDMFDVGTTDVTCTVRDAQNRASSCSFTITVTNAPRIAVTRFLAFGDSITAGATSICGPRTHATLLTPEWRRAEAAFLQAHLVAQPYPSVLEALLAQRYVAQSPIVINAGISGETADDGEDRIAMELSRHAPDVLLLQEGVNDVHDVQREAVSRVPNDLRKMIQEARGRGIQVILGTLLPERAEACKAFDFVDGIYDILDVNDQIRGMAAAENVPLVDLFQLFAGQEATLLGEDGLHPTPDGYALIGGAFFEALRQTLEVP